MGKWLLPLGTPHQLPHFCLGKKMSQSQIGHGGGGWGESPARLCQNQILSVSSSLSCPPGDKVFTSFSLSFP